MRIASMLQITGLAIVTTALVGCGVTPSVQTVTAKPAAISGKVFGGQQAITAGTIQLYTVNSTTDGGTATPILTTTVTTSDGSGLLNANANAGNVNNTLAPGYFNITGDYSCPTGDELVFLTASGGNPGISATTNNNAIQFIAALGSCQNLKTNVQFIVINELTTVGTVAALYPYMTAYNAIGSTPAHASALTSAFNLANEYVNFQNGAAPGPALPSGYYASANDVNALGNVLAACVNTAGYTPNDGSHCDMLFADATPPATGVAPTDTVGAMLDIRTNPTHNVTTLFNLQSTTPPFPTTSSAQSTDFTLPILVQPGTPAFSPAAGSYSTAQSVIISDSDPTAVIYYTTNGSTPTTSSTVYTGPLSIATSETLTAIAVESGRAFSAVGSAAYSGTLVPVTPTVSLSSVTSPYGSTTPVTITASSTANGSVVTFGVSNPATGSFSPATCTITGGSCSVSYIPDGTLSAATYTNDLSASFAAAGIYSNAGASSSLTIPSVPTYVVTGLASFNGVGTNVAYGNIMQGSDGNFYGMTSLGGFFKMNPTGTLTVLHSFTGGGTSAGRSPFCSCLVQATDGNFYGMTSSGGAYSYGTVLRLTSSGTFTLLHSFSDTTGDGGAPRGGLIQAKDGNFYGMAAAGGLTNDGIIFRINAAGSFTLLYSFLAATTGSAPFGNLVQGSDGAFYGMTYDGGAANDGTVFRFDASAGTFTLLHTFTGSDGKYPVDSLLQASDGNFYGVTESGGANSAGAAFRITSSGTFTLLHSFANTTSDGASPQGTLVQGSDGKFYGTTAGGGEGSVGTIYQMSPSGSVSLVHSFGYYEGKSPEGGLIQGNDGNFYGVTPQGGAYNVGTVYKLSLAPALAAPVTLNVPASVMHGTAFTLGYAVSNASSTTFQTCSASNTSTQTDWNGPITGSPIVTNATLTAPATAGTYTYALTCGGMESGFATLTVQ